MCAHCTVDYLSAAVGGDRPKRGADFLERKGEWMEGEFPLVLDRALEAMVLENVDLLVLGSGRSLLGRERERVFHYQHFGKYVLCCSGMAMMCACVSKGTAKLVQIRGVNFCIM